MIDKGKISVVQMGMIVYLMIGATAILIVPSVTTKYAGRDMWLSPIFSSLMGFFAVWIAWKLHQFTPGESIIGSSEKILGRVLGKGFSFLFLFFLLHVVGGVTRQYGEFLTGAFFSRTPLVVVMGSIILVCAFAVRGGIEVIARCAQIFLPLVIFFSLFMIILTIPSFDVKNMFPVVGYGWMPAVKGSIVPDVWFLEFFFISFLFPVLNRRKKVLRGGMAAVFALMVTMMIANLVCLFVIGDLTPTFSFPVYAVGTYISVADFLEHLDAVIMAIWVGGGFIQISVWYYALVAGTARWLNLSDFRSLVFPLGFLGLLSSIWVTPNLQDLVFLFATTEIPWAFFSCAVYPLFLLCVAIIRRKSKIGHSG